MQRRETGSRVLPLSRVLPTGPVIVQAAPEARREPEAPAPAPGSSYVTRGSLFILASQVALAVTNLPANTGDTRDVGSITWEDPLEEVMATPSSVLAWRVPRTEEPSGLQSMGLQRVRHDRSDLAHMLLCFTLVHFVVFRALFLFVFCFSACPKTAS